MQTERMLYKRYKKSCGDCDTVPGSYDKSTKTIMVIILEGGMKSSGKDLPGSGRSFVPVREHHKPSP